MRTKYGIVLSVLIAIVLVAFILGDQLSMAGGQETADEVELVVNGKEIKTKEYQEAYQAVGNEADVRPYVVFENYYGPELEQIGITTLDEKEMKRVIAETLADSGATREQVTEALNTLSPAVLRLLYAQYAASMAVGESFYLNTADLTAYEAQDKLSFDGRYVRYPYGEVADTEVSVSDEEVRNYYDSHLLPNPAQGQRTLVYVEFPHAEVATATEEGEAAAAPKVEYDADSVTADVEAFKEAASGNVEKFRNAASEAGYIVNQIEANNNLGFQIRSQQLHNWARVSPVNAIGSFAVEGKTYVVMVEAIDENEYIPFEEREMDIRTKLINAKKYEILAETMAITDKAEKFEGVKFNDSSRDMHLVGAICASKEGDVVKVMGDDAAYIFVVDKVNGELGDVKSQAVAHLEKNRPGFTQSVESAYSMKLEIEDPRQQQK